MLQLDNLSVGYDQPRGTVLEGLTMAMTGGRFICVLGRNGAGKSTLMRTLAGLQAATAGRALLEGEDIAAMRPHSRARCISVVLTERLNSPGMTVDDVVGMGRQPFTNWQGRLSGEDMAIVASALQQTGADRFSARLFDALSDGERQRVMIARAMAQAPRLMILDEITAFLDLPGRVEVMSLLRRHAHDHGSIVLLSSHDLDLSLQLADEVWLLDGAGKLIPGTSGELIAAGHVGRAFDTQDVRFSADLSRFVLVR